MIAWFVALTRFEPSILRAGAMAALSATAFLTGRERSPVRLLSIAVLALVLIDPLLVWSVGFWLSVGATAGVCAIGPVLARRFSRLGPLATPLGITLGAQIGVMLPSLLVFGRLPLVSVPANLLAVPVAGAVMLYGLPAALVAGLLPASGPRRDVPHPDRHEVGRHGGDASARGSNQSRRGTGSGGSSSSRRCPRLSCARRDPVRIEVAMTTYLLTGDDESILRTAVVELVDRLVGDGDRSMMVDEFDGDDYELRVVVDAAQTPPFLAERRVVIARGVGRFLTDEVAPLVAYVGNPLDTTELVLVANGGKVAKKLTDAVKADGTVTNSSPPTRAKDLQAWVADHIAAAGLRVKPDAAAQLAQWLGEDVGRLDGILATLRSTYGSDHTVTIADVQPFLGDAGGVPPWDFTDAIDAGNTTKALTLLGQDDERRRQASAAGDVDPAQPLRGHRQARRRRRPQRAGRDGGHGDQVAVPGEEGAAELPAARRGVGEAGRRTAGSGRSRSARGERSGP